MKLTGERVIQIHENLLKCSLIRGTEACGGCCDMCELTMSKAEVEAALAMSITIMKKIKEKTGGNKNVH